jgi:hypothetical protein
MVVLQVGAAYVTAAAATVAGAQEEKGKTRYHPKKLVGPSQ